ncbi:MAG: NAD-dependent epimerase/dehydratase family protein, partial [Candidatus Omnitrophica bacterium]|nr:NAD-dependent epimerase/dehydratase family protein [Candidatus Omnitrophota bacterium]
LAKRLKIKRLIYTSSVSVVNGNQSALIADEMPYNSRLKYGNSKIEAEKIVKLYRQSGREAAILRPCMVYGKGEPHLTPKLKILLKLRLIPLINGGQNKTHLVSVKTVVDALIFAAEENSCLKNTIIVADKEILTMKEILTIMSKSIGAKPPIAIPRPLNWFLFNLPFLGKRFRLFVKDRIYSTKELEESGFKFRFQAKESLSESI